MIKFLFKGVLRDSARSKFPIIIVALGVMVTVFMVAFLGGVFNDMIDINARFSTGHVKVTTLGYAENASQNPLDLALLGVEEIEADLNDRFPELDWVSRINFGGLIDLPGEDGETKGQGPATGQAVDFFTEGSKEVEKLNIEASMRQGNIPQQPGEALISEKFAQKTGLKLGDEVTFFGSTMYGSMSFQTFTVSGTLDFGNPALDRGGFLIDITDARQMLDMEDGATEMLGYFKDGQYDNKTATQIAVQFNEAKTDTADEFSSTMQTLKQQNGLGSLIDVANSMQGIMVFVFILAMSIVLWNVGLLGGIRRFKEFGVRLALGESKGTIFKTVVMEGAIIGFIGSLVGTILAIALVIPMNANGLDFGSMMQQGGGAMMMPTIFKPEITASIFYIGFVPGLGAMLIGQALSGIGIYRRSTAGLFKELEV